MNKQLLKTSGADVLSPRRKLRKTLGVVASTPTPPVYVREQRNKKNTLKGGLNLLSILAR